MKDYKPSWTEEFIEYRLIFYTDRSGGLSFPCDENGNVDRTKLEPPAIRNLDFALNHPEKYTYAFNKVEKIRRTIRNPATGICECGKLIELHNEYLGAGECSYCGRWHNLFGQLLNNPRTWRNGDDW